MDSQGRMVCKLKLKTKSGWQKTLTKLIKRVKGVSYSIDAEEGVAHVSGGTDPDKLLTNIEKCDKHAKLVRADCESRYSWQYGLPPPHLLADGFGFGSEFGNQYTNHPYWETDPYYQNYMNTLPYEPRLMYHNNSPYYDDCGYPNNYQYHYGGYRYVPAHLSLLPPP